VDYPGRRPNETWSCASRHLHLTNDEVRQVKQWLEVPQTEEEVDPTFSEAAPRVVPRGCEAAVEPTVVSCRPNGIRRALLLAK
jgi:redox-sensitive bicupin YhaK (pirin superfamily)